MKMDEIKQSQIDAKKVKKLISYSENEFYTQLILL